MNPRQLSIAVWLLALLILCIAHRDIRSSIADVIRLALKPALLVPAGLSLAWNAGVLHALNAGGLWNPALWWDTVAFVFAGTTALVWQAMDSKDHSRRYYRDLVLATLGFSAVVGTLGNTYTFSIPVELLLVPWLVLLGAIHAFAQSSEEYAVVVRIADGLITVTGLAMLVRAIGGAVADFDGLWGMQVVQSITLLFALTVAYMPFLFALRVWSSYQDTLLYLRIGKPKPLKLRLYTAAKLFARHGLRLTALNRFREQRAYQLRLVANRDDVNSILGASDDQM
ncbi:MAG: hypothetical protein IBX63_11660 [Coriobacteriia bacterium]|nr:hypothetical protein [Coriobacteriia bacterium]